MDCSSADDEKLINVMQCYKELMVILLVVLHYTMVQHGNDGPTPLTKRCIYIYIYTLFHMLRFSQRRVDELRLGGNPLDVIFEELVGIFLGYSL